MPIYEYRCPDGHVFEVFQKMAEAPREVCDVCGQGPVEKVLYPVSVHFKGSGFYSTDYGRGGRKKTEASGDGASESGGTEKKTESDSSSSEQKAAATE